MTLKRLLRALYAVRMHQGPIPTRADSLGAHVIRIIIRRLHHSDGISVTGLAALNCATTYLPEVFFLLSIFLHLWG